ncbi:hypothetical protein DIZ76_012260 [Coccidioides immitis]|nr:hypothetical protein DIZ76_012260 [Coccidioides immitis]
MYGQLEMVRFLIDHGANIDKSWASRASPVYLAALYAYPNITKMLLDAGASMATKGPGVASLLSCAATGKSESEAIMRRRAHTVKVVLDAGAPFEAFQNEIPLRERFLFISSDNELVNAQVRPDSDSHALLGSADMYDDKTRDRLQKIESEVYASEVASNRSKEAPRRIKPSECVFPDSIWDLDKELEMPSLADPGEFSEPDETLLDEMALSPGSTGETQSQDSGRFMQHTVGSDEDLGSDWGTRLPSYLSRN